MWWLTLWCLFVVLCNASETCAPRACNSVTKLPASPEAQVLRIGSMLNTSSDQTSQSLARWAVYRINNDPSILPGITLQLYEVPFIVDDASAFAAAMELSDNKQVSASISNMSEHQLDVTSQILTAYNVVNVDLFSTMSLNIGRTTVFKSNPVDFYEFVAIARVLVDLGIGSAAFVYEDDINSIGLQFYNDFSFVANQANISTVAISSSATVILRDARYARAVVYSVPSLDYAKKFDELARQARMIGPSYLSRLLQETRVLDFLDGSFGVSVPQDLDTAYASQIINEWAQADIAMFPGSRSPTSWAAFDAVYVIANAYQKALPTLSASTIYEAVRQTNQQSMNGQYFFDSLNTRISKLAFSNFVDGATRAVLYGEVDWPALLGTNPNSILKYGNYTVSYTTNKPVFYGGSTTNPASFVRIWEMCNATICYNNSVGCSDEGACICSIYYTGKYCENVTVPVHHVESISVVLVIAIVVPASCIIIAAIATFWAIYRRRRNGLFKLVAEHQSSAISRDDFELQGAIGGVHRAIYKAMEVAVKKIQLSHVSSDILDEFQLETALLSAYKHPNIVLFMGSCIDEINKEVFLIMEFMESGSLYDALHNAQIDLPYELKVNIASQVAQGLRYLHGAEPSVVHRDLNSRCIFLDEQCNAKISGFGLDGFQRLARNDTSGLRNTFWTAPEVLNNPQDFSPASDCYSFGVILWELFHRAASFNTLDAKTLAFMVTTQRFRPPIRHDCPPAIATLIEECWEQNPKFRPPISQVVSRLNELIGDSVLDWQVIPKIPHYSKSEEYPFPEVNNLIYIVHTEMPGVYNLWDQEPTLTKLTIGMHNDHIRDTIERFNGVEQTYEFSTCGFRIAFSTIYDAVNWCVSTQVSLMHLEWPEAILESPVCAAITSKAGEQLWRGPRVRMSIYSGYPDSLETSSGELLFSGPVVEKAKSMLSLQSLGSIIASVAVVNQLERGADFVDHIVMEQYDPMNPNEILQVVPLRLQERLNITVVKVLSHVSIGIVESPIIQTPGTFFTGGLAMPSWMLKWSDLVIGDLVGQGTTGNFYLAEWSQQKVVVEVLANQNLSESEFIHLMRDQLVMSTDYIDRNARHSKLLPALGICTEPGHISFVCEHIPYENLTKLLGDDTINMPSIQRLEIALNIAEAMQYVTSHPELTELMHNNLKSSNVLVSRLGDVRLIDFGQDSIKEVVKMQANTSNVAWIAPEILQGEESAKRSQYAFGFILWELFTRKVPFEGEHPVMVMCKVANGYRPPFNDEFSVPFKQLVKRCWDFSQPTRPTWDIIVEELHAIIHHSRVAKLAGIDTESMCSDEEETDRLEEMERLKGSGCESRGARVAEEECAPLELSSEVEEDIEDMAKCDGFGTEETTFHLDNNQAYVNMMREDEGESTQEPNYYLDDFECTEDDDEGGATGDAEETIVNYFSDAAGVVRHLAM